MSPLRRCLLFSGFVLTLAVPAGAQAASRYWVGSSGGNWNDTANWSAAENGCGVSGGASVPGSSDTAYFTGTCTNSGSLNATVNVAGFVMATAYSGTLTQATEITMTIGSSGWTQSGGTLTGGDSSITMNGVFTLAGGTFTATTGTTALHGNFLRASGTFVHNSGAVVVGVSTTFNPQGAAFNDITFNSTNNSNTCSSSFSVMGDLRLSGSSGNGIGCNATSAVTITLYDDFIVSASTDARFGSESVTVVLAGGGTQTVTKTGGTSVPINANVTVNKSSGTVLLGSAITFGSTLAIQSANSLNTQSYALAAKTLTNQGTLTLGTGAVSISAGGSLTAGSVQFNNLTISSTCSSTLIMDSFTVRGNLSIGESGCNGGVQASAARTITLLGNFTQSGGSDNNFGGSSYDGGHTITLVLSGSTTQTLAVNSGKFYADVRTAKSAGTVQLGNSLTMNTSGQDLTLTSGTLNLNGNNLTVNDQFTLGTGSTLRLKGSETISGGPDTIYANTTVWYDDDAGSDTLLNLAYKNLVVGSPGSATFTLPANTAVAGALTLSGGTLDANGNTMTVTGLATVSGGEYQAKTATQTLNGGLTVSGGTFTGSSGAVDVNGTVTLSSGTLTAPSGSFTVSGNWAKSGGTFTPGSGPVTLDGTSQQVTGSTSFGKLTKTVASADTLTFEAGQTQTVTDTLTLQGAAGNLLSLRSSADGTPWYLTPSGVTRSVRYLSVKDSWNPYTDDIDCVGYDCTDAGNNEGWKFVNTDAGGGAAATQSWTDFWKEWEAEHGGGGGRSGGGSPASTSPSAPLSTSPALPSPPPTYVPPPRPVRITPLDRKAQRIRRLLNSRGPVGQALPPRIVQTGVEPPPAPAQLPPPTLRDVPKNAWYAAAVETLRLRGFVQGLKTKDGSPTGLFEPARSVTHAELLKMALLAAGKNPPTTKTAPANPTARGTWAAPYVAMAEDLKLSLFAYGNVLPVNAPATRAQAIQPLVDLFAPDAAGSGTASFTDVPPGHPNRQAIAVAFKLGWVRGDTDGRGFPTGTFRPSDTISRAEVAKILDLIIKGRE